jgi:hypothetical protein
MLYAGILLELVGVAIGVATNDLALIAVGLVCVVVSFVVLGVSRTSLEIS